MNQSILIKPLNLNNFIRRLFLTTFIAIGLSGLSAQAQSYDDFTKFSSEPTALDDEAREVFGRFFQTEITIGTSLFSGGLGSANSPGVNLGLRFIIYFDQIWAMEIGGFYARHSSAYTPTNTGEGGINYGFTTKLITPSIGFRYGFDQESLPRGFSTLNPYFSVNAEVFFRSEKATDINGPDTNTSGFVGSATKFQNETNNSNAFGFSIGGGTQFDVYKGNLFLALDLRYHFAFWDDKAVKIGTLNRAGSYITILGAFVINY